MELKQAFILKCLAEYNDRVIAAMKQAMQRMKVHDTGEGEASLAYRTMQAGNGAMSKLSFREYLRFVDMGVGRAHPLGGLRATTVTLQASKKEGIALVKDRVRKPKKFYSKVAYGQLSYLAGKLAYGYSEEVINTLKKELESNNPQP